MGFGEIMMGQCRLLNYNKCTTLVRDIDNAGGNGWGGIKGIWKISIATSTQFCVNPKLL